jgi:hypothetical protein
MTSTHRTTTRRGFRKAPQGIRTAAERAVADFGPGAYEVRSASYCGPDSAGARGAWVLLLNGRPVRTIEAR